MSEEKLLNYFKGDELPTSVWKGKYAYQDEQTPDDMHKRMAKEFARIEAKYHKVEAAKDGQIPWSQISDYGRNRSSLGEVQIYNLFKDFKYTIPQGSVMSSLGTDKIASLSNCVVVNSPLDSYGSIMYTDTQLTALFKRRCGAGFDLSNLRPVGSPVNNTAESTTGAVSFMERFSNTTREVAMAGRK